MAYDEDLMKSYKALQKLYKALYKNFDLLCSIIQQPTNGTKLKVDLSIIEEIINTKIPETLKDYAPENFYELYTDFKSVYEKFRDFILYDKLIGKNIVALGGGFSSGKSSFLNALMEKHILPEDIEPSTSVPTYIVSGEEGKKYSVMGINVFDTKVMMQPLDIRSIAHGFGELENADGEKVTNEATLGHILESIFFSTELHKYENLAFLDTPGYSKPDSEQYSVKTDAQIARGQLNSSNYILWFVQADAGTITEEDIKFIKTLKGDIPKLIVVNKADKKSLKDLKDIIAKIKANLDIKGIKYVDVFSFSSCLNLIEDDELKQFIEKDKENIQAQIGQWNKEIYESNFAWNFKQLFVECKDYYENEIDEERRKLSRLQPVTTLMENEILELLNPMVEASKKKVNKLNDIRKNLKELQDEFFTEIKRIADIVGIAMPEPSEIDLLQDKVQNPLQIIEAYKKEKGIKTDPAIVDMFKNMFEGIEPVINKQAGGTEYRNELLDVIREYCTVAPGDIHINDVLKNTEEYKAIIKNA